MKKTNKKKRTPTAKILAKLSPAEKKARAKKLEYVNLKTKLEKAGLWKSYLKAKKAGEAGRGESMGLMQRIASGKDPKAFNAPKDSGETETTDVEEASPVLIRLATQLVKLDRERASVANKLKELL